VIKISQQEICDWLAEKRKESARWFTVQEIKEGISLNNLTSKQKGLTDDLLRLSQFDLIECKGIGLWNHYKVFRACKVK
jgi:hypothetical protein